MKHILKYLVGLIAFVAMSCTQQDALLYDSAAQVSFTRDIYGQQDSVIQSFFTVREGQTRDTVWVEISLTGFPVDENRPVSLVQTNIGDPDAAVAGTHYVDFNDEEVAGQFVMKANQVQAKVPVILLWDKSLNSEKKRLKLAIAANDYFQPGIDTDCNFLIQTTALAEQPTDWQANWFYVFGDWGPRKMWFIMHYLGIRDFGERIEDMAYRDYLRLKAHSELVKYNETSEEPLCEDLEKHHEDGKACPKCVSFMN